MVLCIRHNDTLSWILFVSFCKCEEFVCHSHGYRHHAAVYHLAFYIPYLDAFHVTVQVYLLNLDSTYH